MDKTVAIERAGAKMANVMFNLAQNPGRALTQDECTLLRKLQREWDEAIAAAPALAAQDEREAWPTIVNDYRALEEDWNKLMNALSCDDTASALSKIAAITAPQDAQEHECYDSACKECYHKAAQPADKPEGKAEQQEGNTPYDEGPFTIAQPQQLTDDEIKLLAAEYLCDEYGFWRAPETSEIMNFARALLAAGKERK